MVFRQLACELALLPDVRKQPEESVDGISQDVDVIVIALGIPCSGVPEAWRVGIGEDKCPGLAPVLGLVESRERAFAAGHDDCGGVVDGLYPAKVQPLGPRRHSTPLPALPIVRGPE